MNSKSFFKQHFSAIVFLICFILFFYYFVSQMGLANMLNTLMNTAYRLLIDTCFYLMAIAVLAGAIGALFAEFGVIDLLNKILSPLMKPLFGLPGVAALGVVTTYLSDNPAIIALAKDDEFCSCFKKYQLPALTNLGTSFGMGMIVTTFTLAQSKLLGSQALLAAVCGNIGAIVGCIVSTRLLLAYSKKRYSHELIISEEVIEEKKKEENISVPLRFMNALMDGGKRGVDLGLQIIPGVLIICSIVMMLTFSAPETGYSGGAYEGIALLPALAHKFGFVFEFLFGFSHGECVSVPVTAIGSAGAALSIIPSLIEDGYATVNDLAVFCAICMCWSGYLSTHVSMMDVLGYKELTGKAILYHTIGGLVAGVCAHYLFFLLTSFI